MLPEPYCRFDRQHMFDHIHAFPEQMEEAMGIGRKFSAGRDYSSVKGIQIAGMGGSAIAGDVATVLASGSFTVPVSVTRNYVLPGWVNSDTLVLLLSYSGNTEETLSCLDDALARKAMVAGITSGGKLKRRLTEAGADLVTIPSGLPPRASLGYLTIPVLYLLYKGGIISDSMESEVVKGADHLKTWRDVFSRADQSNPAYEIASTIYRTIPAIYGEADSTATVALRWRTQLEENAKMVAIHHSLPEMNHNEIMGYFNNADILKNLSIIWLVDDGDHPRIKTRQKLTRDSIGDTVMNQISVKSRGNTRFERLFYLVHLGDWVSFWAAMLHGTDPTPVAQIEQLKLALSK